MNRYDLHEKSKTVKTPVDLENKNPRCHDLCRSLHSLRGIDVTSAGRVNDVFMIFFHAKEVRDLAPIVRAIDRRYGGSDEITVTCECTDSELGITFCMTVPNEDLMAIVHRNLEYLKHDVIATNSRKFLEVQFSE